MEKQTSKRDDKIKIAIIVIVFLALVNLATAAGLFYFRYNAVHYKNPYPLLDPARSFVDQKNFFPTIEPLRKKMKELVKQYEEQGNQIGVYFEYLNTGANISINQDTRFWPASLSKMPTVLAVMKKVEDGEWQLSNEMVLFAEDKDQRFGDLYKKATGTRFTIEELLKETLINSDNTSHRILVRNLSSEDYTDCLEALGMEQLYDENYDITAKEYSRIFRSLYVSSYLTRPDSEQLLKWLSQTPFDELLGSSIPDDVQFAHKIGEAIEESAYLDSGIVYVSDRPYLMTVMIKAAGNFSQATAEVTINSLKAPVITEYDQEIVENDLLRIRGNTYPNVEVNIYITNSTGQENQESVRSNLSGYFSLTWPEHLDAGSYSLTAQAVDDRGAKSEFSQKVNFEVKPLKWFQRGNTIFAFIIITILLISLVVVLIIFIIRSCRRFFCFKKKTSDEIREIQCSLRKTMGLLKQDLASHLALLEKAQNERPLTSEEQSIMQKLKKNLNQINRLR